MGKVVGIDHLEELTKFAENNVLNWFNHSTDAQKGGIQLGKQLKLLTGDGRKGWLPEAPYDAIHVGAAAPIIPSMVYFLIYY